jgi:hypothetical protein
MTGIWRNWMNIWCITMIVSGLIFVLAAFPATDKVARLFYDFVYWPLDGQSGFSDAARPSIAILGAVFLAFAVLIQSVVKIALDDPSSPLWRVVTTSVVVWWIVDSAASIICGIPVNVVTNTILLMTFLVPILGSGVLKRDQRASRGD